MNLEQREEARLLAVEHGSSQSVYRRKWEKGGRVLRGAVQ